MSWLHFLATGEPAFRFSQFRSAARQSNHPSADSGRNAFRASKKREQNPVENAIINPGTKRSVIIDIPGAPLGAGGAIPEGFPGRFDRLVMHTFIHWLVDNGGVLAVVVTAGVAILLVCCLECSNCSCSEKDDLFKHHEV